MKRFLLPVVLCLVLAGCNLSRSDIKPANLTTEYKEDAFTDVASPRFSWINLSGKKGALQSSYQIRVFKDLEHPEQAYWDSAFIFC